MHDSWSPPLGLSLRGAGRSERRDQLSREGSIRLAERGAQQRLGDRGCVASQTLS